MEREPRKTSTQIVKADPGWNLVCYLHGYDEPGSLDIEPLIAFCIDVWENCDDDEPLVITPVACWGRPTYALWCFQRPDGKFSYGSDIYETEQGLLDAFRKEHDFQEKMAAKRA